MNALVIKNLTKKYGKFKAVDDISFEVKKGSFLGFIGPNGAGKTTTIRSIMGLTKYEGSITVLGHDIASEFRQARAIIGLSPQEYNFDRFLTAELELEYTAGYYGIPRKEAKKRTEKLLRRFDLWEHRKKMSERLSGGMKRRLIVARALMHQPKLLILDEPTAALDVELRRSLWDELRDINKKGTTIILTSHYLDEVELLCNDVGIIHQGKLLAMGKKDKIMADMSSEMLTIETNKKIPDKVLAGFTVERETGKTLIMGKGVKAKTKAILDNVERAGIKIQGVETGRESLEHVFLRITGNGK